MLGGTHFWKGLAICLIYGPILLMAVTPKPSTQDAEAIFGEALTNKQQWSKEAFQRSASRFIEASEAFEHIGDHKKAADCLHQAAEIELKLSSPKAIPLAQKALHLARSYRLREAESSSMSVLAIGYLKAGNIRLGEFYSTAALRLAKEIDRPDLLGKANFAAAEVQYEKQDYKKMLDLQKIGLHFIKLTEDRPEIAERLATIGFSYIINDQVYQGLDAANESFAIAKDLNDPRAMAFALLIIGEAQSRYGEWQSAIASFRQAESGFPEGVDLFEHSILLNRIGRYYLTFGDLQTARTYLERSLLIFNSLGDTSGVSEISTVLGKISMALGDEAAAGRYFNDSLRLVGSSDNYTALALLKENIGELNFQKGNLALAREDLSYAVTTFQRLGLGNAAARASIALGRISEEQDDLPSAGHNYETALNIYKKLSNSDGIGEALFNLARLKARQGSYSKAIEDSTESLRLNEIMQGQTRNGRLRSLFRSNTNERYELNIHLLMKGSYADDPEKAATALIVAEKARGWALLENLEGSKENSDSGNNAETKQEIDALRAEISSRSDKLTALLINDAKDPMIRDLDAEIAGLENKLARIEATEKAQKTSNSELQGLESFDLADFRTNTLDDDSLLLEFSLGRAESYLWVVGKSSVDVFVLPPREVIERRIDRLRELLVSRSITPGESTDDYQKRITEAESTYASEARELSGELLGQAASMLSGKRLIVVADGRLQYFPLAALPMPNSPSDDPILLTNEVVYEPSAAALKMILAETREEFKSQKDILVFSDPVFSKTDERLSGIGPARSVIISALLGGFRSITSLDEMPRLPASEQEAESIADVVGSRNTVIRSGFAANRESVINGGIDQYKVLHFATHGMINQERPELSGILLSLYDEAGAPQSGGLIRLQDVYGLKLHTDLVVLSACDTALGKDLKGEGLMSLNNAFLGVGAKSVVASLWKVDDNATRQLMTDFYNGLAVRKQSAPVALRNAQLKMYKDPRFRSPFFWASFAAQGDYKRVPDIGGGIGNWIYLGGIIPFIALGFYLVKRRRKQRSA